MVCLFSSLTSLFDEDLSINYLDTYEDTATWNGDVSEGNVIVMAAVFNVVSHKAYAYPPSRNPFDAYYVDAAAAATPGNTGYNTVIENFTHTVFVEEGTATWCQYCPSMANVLNSVYESGNYPFYFVALIDDKSSDAANRLRNDYNIYGFPTAFFDGGYKVLVGAQSSETSTRNNIKACGKRDVHELNLTLSVQWLGDGDLKINVSITNNEIIHNPDKPATPTGQTKGKIGVEYTYCTSTTDPDEDQVYYWFEWGDGTNSSWIGPYPSGETACANHSWETKGDYEIKVKAKDTGGLESEWSDPLPVTMPRDRQSSAQLFLKLLEMVANRFPMLKLLMR